MRSDTDRHGQQRTGTDSARTAPSRTPSAAPARRPAGFTLMELLIVIAIMAIISTAAIGGYFGMQRSAAYSAAHDNVYNTLTLAKQRAVIDGKVTSLMILSPTNYIVVRAAGRITLPTPGANAAFDVYSDLSGALYCDLPDHDLRSDCPKKIDIYNLETDNQGAKRSVAIHRTLRAELRDERGVRYTVAEAFRFDGAGDDFFAVGDRYGFALHEQQALPRGYLFTGQTPQEIRFNTDGSCPEKRIITIEEKIRRSNKIEFEVAVSGTITDKSTVRKE